MLKRIPPRYAKLPRHAKAFAMPVILSPKERALIGVTPFIREYVAGFKAKGIKEIAIARAIVEDIRSFKEVALPLEEAKKQWGKRSAEEIIKARVQYIMNREEAARTGKPAIIGCTDLAIAIVASLRATGFKKTLIVRAGTHTYAKFLYRNRVWIADPRGTKRLRVRPMKGEDKRLENRYRAANAFAEGKSLAAIGINLYDDFFKYKYILRS